MRKKFLSLTSLAMATILTFSGFGISQVKADTTTNIDVSVEATDVDITVPLNFACSIDPNIENGFTYADNLTVTSNTKAPIVLSVASFVDSASTFENDILPDGLPSGKTWDNLSVSETMKYFALGLKVKDSSEWESSITDTLYAKTINDAGTNSKIGVILPDTSVKFDLDAKYGRAFKQAETFTYQITWIAELYEGEDGA